jgi:hypothetical protein
MSARYRLWGAMAGAASLALSAAVGWAAGSPNAGPTAVVMGLQCPSRTLCLGLGGSGPHLVTSRAPLLGLAGGPRRASMGPALRLLACASRWCVAVDRQQRVFVSLAIPAVGGELAAGAGWSGPILDDVGELSCPSPRLCVGVAGQWVISSVRPQRGGTAWRRALVNHGAWEQAVDCPTITRCVAVSDDGGCSQPQTRRAAGCGARRGSSTA